ncbi:hypothetical protein VNO78_03946 [Psophocarpus tetragonolobus]|uniref:PGG domain-containing protein n=1 Tax=Psophocarpus tetragonolobus TaxID=3891 RepID=A0AAN9T177_PSOTE
MSDLDTITLSVSYDIPHTKPESKFIILKYNMIIFPVKCHDMHAGMQKREIYIAAASGNWNEASSCFKMNPHWWRIPLTAYGATALHIAVIMRKTRFVEKLVMNYMNIQDMEIGMADGNTAFCLAAITGNMEIVKILFGKNPKLLWIRGQKDMLPIQLASSAGHILMTQFLFQYSRKDLDNNMPFQDIVNLFFLNIINHIYTVTSKLLVIYPKLATIENEKGLTPLQMLAQLSLSKKTIGLEETLRLLFKGMDEEKESPNTVQLSKAMFDAAKSGNIMILELLFKYNPDLLFEVDFREQRNLLHIAILYRQESVYRLILSKGDSINVMTQFIDSKGNNVLHLAGHKSLPEDKFGLSTDHVLMRSEEIWFQFSLLTKQEVEKTMKNKANETPKELFYSSHKELHKESVSGVKALADTLIVVAALIITLGITAAITVPIKDIDSTLTPIFRKKTWYTFFFLSTALGTFLCAASMIFYASIILPSNWEPKDEYIHTRQTKLVFGNITLVASLGLMFASMASGSILIFDFLSSWIFYFIAGLACLTLALHPFIDYNLWTHSVQSVVSFCQTTVMKQAKVYITHCQRK